MFFRVNLFLVILCRISGSLGQRAGQGRAIIGGKSAMPGQYPYLVSIRNKFGQHNCGGSIVTKNWILSASHCFSIDQNPRRIYVLAGTVTLDDGGEVRRVDKIARWDKVKISPADIIMLKVKKSFVFDDLIQPVKLPFQDEDIRPGTHVQIMGWGYKKNVDGHITNDLQFAELELYPTDDCVAFFNIGLAENYSMRLCAGSKHGERDSCVGDSGGPMVVEGKQIGIVSYGSPVCGTEKGRLAVYTKVAYFANWVRSVAGCDECR